MEYKGKLFVFSAPSGSGKTTIVRGILNSFDEVVFSVSATTRKKRNNEKNGNDYFFISEKEFENKIRNNDFIEWERFYDYYYGTLKSFVEEKLVKGLSVVLEVDVKGALKIKDAYPNSVLIFISPPDKETLKQRLIDRKTETASDLEKRIKRAEMELTFKDKFDYVVINNELDTAVDKVKKIIRKEINK